MSAETLFFVHIPKTAGTSFRFAAEAAFGAGQVIYDYGPASHKTHSGLQENLYQPQSLTQWGCNHPLVLDADFEAVNRWIKAQDMRLFGGHCVVHKYRHLFPSERTVTFMRNPVDRVVSFYHHHVRQLNYGGTLREFAAEKRFANLQSFYTRSTPVSEFGFIGITEQYQASIQLFNATYDVALPIFDMNQKPARQHDDLDEDTARWILKHNQEDVERYQEALHCFDERLHRCGLAGAAGIRQMAQRLWQSVAGF